MDRESKTQHYEHEDDDYLSESASTLDSSLINPFGGKRQEEMEDLIDEFMAETEIEVIYKETVRKGAFLAQDPEIFKGTNDGPDNLRLTTEEREALRREDPIEGNKWDQPWVLYALVACCSLGAAVQGMDETAVNGAQIFYQYAFNIQHEANDQNHNPSYNNSGVRGLVNGAPLLACAVLGCWLTQPLNYMLGRRGTIFVTCLVSSLACVWQAFTNSWQHLFAARFVMGIAIGAKSATVPVFSAECVPSNIRGALVMMWQMWVAFGIMLGYIAGVIFRDVLQGDTDQCKKYRNPQDWKELLKIQCSLNWRLMLASPMALPLIAAAYVFTLPESPRWLLSKARRSNGNKLYYRRALYSLMRLRHSRLQAARDLFLMYYLLDRQFKIKKRRNRFIELWAVGRNRRALVASLIVMFLQQICGVNVMAFYSSDILSQAWSDDRDGDKKALLASMGFGIINWVFALPAVWTIDTFGRRNLLLSTYPFMALSQGLIALSFVQEKNTPDQIAMMLAGMYLFSVFFSPGQGPVPFVYAAESMPLYVRDLGMSMATATIWFFNFLLAVTFPSFQNSFGRGGAFGYYAAWCVIAWFLVFIFVVETKDLSLEQLDACFEISTKEHVQWARKELTWAFRYYVLRQRSLANRRPPLILASGKQDGRQRSIVPRVKHPRPIEGSTRGDEP